MRSLKLLCVVFALLMSFWVVPRAEAQANPNFEVGLKPYGAYDAGNIDNVSLGNGSLGVDIPLISYPQRGGKLKLSFSVRYFNGSVSGSVNCYPNGEGGEICIPIYSPSEAGWALVDDGAVFSTVEPGQHPCCTTAADANYLVEDSTGATHPLGAVSGQTNVLESVDATGYRVPWNTTTGEFSSIVDAQGTIFQTPAESCTKAAPFPVLCNVSRVDTDGNQITYSAIAGWTDSLGREIPLPSTTTNYSGCTGSYPTSSAEVWNFPGLDGPTYTVKLCFFTLTGQSNYISPQPSELQSIVLPNGTTWTFTYTGMGLGGGSYPEAYFPTLSGITLPTGGSLAYTWQWEETCQTGSSPLNMAVATRTLSPGSGAPESTSSYSYSGSPGDPSGGVGSGVQTRVVTDPMGNDSVLTFGLGGCYLYETQGQYYQGSQSSGTLLKTATTQYTYIVDETGEYSLPDAILNVQLSTETTNWPNTQSLETGETYDSGFSYRGWNVNFNAGAPYTIKTGSTQYTGSYGLEVTKKEYASSGGSVVRTTTTNYEALTNSSYATANILSIPSSVQVTGSGPGSLTTYGYDASGCSSGACGNQTSVNRYWSTTGTYLPTTNVYNSNGLVTSTTDPKGNSTRYAYGAGYAGSGPTSMTNALSQTTSYTYDFNTGLLTSTTDPNSQTTSYAYDEMLRTLQIDNPGGGESLFCYTDTGTESGGGSCAQSAPPYETVLSEKISSSMSRLSYLMVDGVGRQIRQAVSNGESKPYDEVDTCYDADGRVSFKSYPFQDSGPFATARTCALPELGDSSFYDGLNRICLLVPSDGALPSGNACPSAQPGNDVVTLYSGNYTYVTDEQNHTRESLADGLGRLEQVIENPSGWAYTTDYGYDALDDLTTVSQNFSRNRSFIYDSLALLTSASNPESGTTSYTYDADGNVITKTDARGTTVCYGAWSGSSCNGAVGYDALNRLLEKSYSDGTPTVTYTYDQSSCLGLSNCYNIGQRTSMTDGGNEQWSYGITSGVGWEVEDQRTTNGVTKYALEQDDLLGAPLSIRYPSGRTIDYTPNLGDRPVSVVDASTSVTYANPVHYWANGSACWQDYGAAITAAETFNSRQQPLEIQATGGVVTYSTGCPGLGQTGNLLDLSYNFDLGSADNGNVMGITNNIDTTRSQNFQYDPLNRIIIGETASTYSNSPSHCWGESYVYDNVTGGGGAWGNLTNINVSSSAYNGCTQESLSQLVTADNQISGFCYDAAGNLLGESACPASTYAYNAENELTSTAEVSYTYDGDGKRVEKSNGTLYWYGPDGNVLDETGLTGTVTNEYVYLGGQRIARLDSSANAYYYAADQLSTSRVIAEVPSGSTTATLCYNADFYPFGGERAYTNNCAQNYKFTGKERDAESNLDNFGARYNSSSLGRFLSPDPENYGANSLNPQSWNMYSYVVDNPLSVVDPFGLDCVYLDNSGGTDPNVPGGATIDHNSNESECNGHGGYWANGYIGSLNDVQTFQDNDNALITSQNGADPEITVASQNESQGVSLLGNVPPSFFSGQFADPSYFQQPSLQDMQIEALANGIQAAGRVIPTVCGGGVFAFGGLQGGGAFGGGLVEYDSVSGGSANGLAEGEGETGAGGGAYTSAPKHPTLANSTAVAFVPVTPAAGVVAFGSKRGVGVGGYVGGEYGPFGFGGGAYLNITTVHNCP